MINHRRKSYSKKQFDPNNECLAPHENETSTFLWISDGTTTGTMLFHVIRPGASTSTPIDFTEFGNNLFFRADDGINGNELWTLSCPQDEDIPTLSEWGIFILALILTIIGTVAIRSKNSVVRT